MIIFYISIDEESLSRLIGIRFHQQKNSKLFSATLNSLPLSQQQSLANRKPGVGARDMMSVEKGSSRCNTSHISFSLGPLKQGKTGIFISDLRKLP